MIIVANDKSGFMNLEKVDTVCIEDVIYNRKDCFAIRYYCGDAKTKGTLGIYSTKEKAVKVLDMICDQYQYLQECKYTGIGVNQPEFVFQMPKDSEV